MLSTRWTFPRRFTAFVAVALAAATSVAALPPAAAQAATPVLGGVTVTV